MKLPALLACTLSLAVVRLPAQAAATDSVPGTLVRWTMVAVPAGTVTLPDGTTHTVAAFEIGQTEVPWELFDIFLHRLDVPREQRAGVDAASRPSRPYGAPDRGYGHRGWPVISITHGAAQRFANWLSEKTGRRYAVPTEAQWARAAALGAPTAAHAWHRDNADAATHKVATLPADALGLFDLLGNAGEWVTTAEGGGLLAGGTFQDPPDSVSIARRARQAPSWNSTDPQIPKSRWWLSDGPFAGLRLVRLP